MKAILCTAYGPPEVLRLAEVLRPVPKDTQVLIRIQATSVTAADCEIRRFDFPGWIWLPLRLWFGMRRPRRPILGQDLAGVVEAVGGGVHAFRPGDRVFGTTGVRLGAHAEYICLDENSQDGALALMPAGLGFEEAAAVPYGGLESLQFLRTVSPQPGDKVLIIGAGGSFGTSAVQLARLSGAEVSAVDLSSKHDLLISLGAGILLDHTRADFALERGAYDVIFDVVGKSDLAAGIRALRPRGRYLLSNPRFSHLVRGLWTSLTSSKKVVFGAASGRRPDLEYLRALIESGRLRPVIDRVFPLEQMADAHRRAESGQKLGNVIVRLVQDYPPWAHQRTLLSMFD